MPETCSFRKEKQGLFLLAVHNVNHSNRPIKSQEVELYHSYSVEDAAVAQQTVHMRT